MKDHNIMGIKVFYKIKGLYSLIFRMRPVIYLLTKTLQAGFRHSSSTFKIKHHKLPIFCNMHVIFI